MDTAYLLAMILVMALSNFFTRVFPFLFFVRREPPGWILFLEKWFPPVIMTILVFYSLRMVMSVLVSGCKWKMLTEPIKD